MDQGSDSWIVNSGTDAAPNWRWEYDLKDHLGNVRAVLGDSTAAGYARVLQQNHYYPFGMRMSEISTSLADTSNNYLYNGKELQDDFGLNWYDYGARFYDPSLGRWNSVDPMGEVSRRWSPYAYAYNNPIRFLDPDGMLVDEFQYDTETQEMTRTGDTGGETTQTVTVVNGDGETVGVATVEGNTVNVTQEGNTVEVSGNLVATTGVEGNTTGYTNQSQTFDTSQTLAETTEIKENENTIKDLKSESEALEKKVDSIGRVIDIVNATELSYGGASRDWDMTDGSGANRLVQIIRQTMREFKQREFCKAKKAVDNKIDSLNNVNEKIKSK